MEMEDQYGMADLRQLMVNGRPHFPTIPQQPPDLFSGHRNLTPSQHHYEMMMVGRDMMPRGLHDSAATTATTTTITVTASSTATLSGLETEAGCLLGADAGTGRWPRQETLTLLEIRSRLDPKFKEANQKGPLWDEVSRIMSEEHGYQRSGKKCREKFENLYKYYKKTKEGKAGRQDGKHYRFFRQLEALYGESSINNPVSISETHLVGSNTLRFHTSSNTPTPANQEAFQAPKLCDSLSLSNNSSEFDTSSSDDNDLNATATLMDNEYSAEKSKKRRGRRNWKVKIRDFIDSQMRKLMEKQEAWLEKMMKTIEHKEQERILREEEWRKEEAARLEREHKFWANERAWIQARDVALMDALQKLTGGEVLKQVSSPSDQELINESHETFNVNVKCGGNRWPESEISRLIQLRSNMESRFQQMGCREEILWEEISAKMGCLGYERSPLMCKDKWDSINNYLRKTKECNKKRKENSNSKSCCYYQNNDHNSVVLYNQGGGGGGAYSEINEQGPETGRGLQTNDGSSPSNSNAAGNNPHVHDNCFRFLMGDGENLWDSYGTVKLNKGEN